MRRTDLVVALVVVIATAAVAVASLSLSNALRASEDAKGRSTVALEQAQTAKAEAAQAQREAFVSHEIVRDVRRARREGHVEACRRIDELEREIQAILAHWNVPLSALPLRKDGTRVLSPEKCR